MNFNKSYRKKFEALLEIDNKAIDYLKYYVDRVQDKVVLEKLQEIYRDELRHRELEQKILEAFD